MPLMSGQVKIVQFESEVSMVRLLYWCETVRVLKNLCLRTDYECLQDQTQTDFITVALCVCD